MCHLCRTRCSDPPSRWHPEVCAALHSARCRSARSPSPGRAFDDALLPPVMLIFQQRFTSTEAWLTPRTDSCISRLTSAPTCHHCSAPVRFPRKTVPVLSPCSSHCLERQPTIDPPPPTSMAHFGTGTRGISRQQCARFVLPLEPSRHQSRLKLHKDKKDELVRPASILPVFTLNQPKMKNTQK